MEELKGLSNTGIILWIVVLIAYGISFLIINFYYSRTYISAKDKSLYEKVSHQFEKIIFVVRIIIIFISLSILIGLRFIDVRNMVKPMLILIGIIMPAYFLILIGSKLEERNRQRPVAQRDDSGI